MFQLLSVSCPPAQHERLATALAHLERGFDCTSPRVRCRVRITCLEEEEEDGFENEEDEDLEEFDEGFYDDEDEDDDDFEDDEEGFDDDEVEEEDDGF